MPDIIELLPDSVANQIAAGEVVQRPASVVKELMENSIDAKAKQIDLQVKNAGKTLIKVIDDGIGMSETDARLALERHATSKIKKVDDLFSLTTMGFRGEAIPSISAVSRMEIKTKATDAELGSHLILEGNEVQSQEVCQCKTGTQISVKDLFFNIPARRNFLKSNSVEYRHILEEFSRIALANPTVGMSLNNDGNEVHRLPASNFRQRIVNLFGNKYNQRLVPVEESTDIVKVSGFVGKPEYAKRTRGEQYFFVNGRFIKNAYLNHAVQKAYEELIPSDQFAAYYLKLEIDPARIDINIHPTKTEIKFEEERSIYAIIRTAVRQALGKHNLTPSLDFEQEQSFSSLPKKGEPIPIPQIKVDPTFNPFERESRKPNQPDIQFPFKREQKPQQDWEKLYEDGKSAVFKSSDPQRGVQNERTQSSDSNHWNPDGKSSQQSQLETDNQSTGQESIQLMQLHRAYILSHLKSGFILIDQERAHQRILIDRYQEILKSGDVPSQQLLFPVNLELSAEDFDLLKEQEAEFKKLGFDIREFGKQTYIIQGLPSEAPNSDPAALIEAMIESYKNDQQGIKSNVREKWIQSLAYGSSVKRGQKLSHTELQRIVDELFATSMPYSLPNQKPIIVTYSLEELDKQFKRI
jgi:DNA mismatch repair protein MutL